MRGERLRAFYAIESNRAPFGRPVGSMFKPSKPLSFFDIHLFQMGKRLRDAERFVVIDGIAHANRKRRRCLPLKILIRLARIEQDRERIVRKARPNFNVLVKLDARALTVSSNSSLIAKSPPEEMW